MAATIQDSQAIAKDLHARFDAILSEPRDPLHPKICTTVPSDGAYEKYAEITRIPFPKKWTDERAPQGVDVTNTLTVENNTYELTVDIDENLVEDAKAWELNNFVAEVADRAVELPDKLCSALVEAGATAGSVGINGSTFYSTSQAFAGGANTFSNKLTGTGTTLIQLKTDFYAAVAAMKTWLDNEGGLINRQLKEGKGKLVVQCHPSIANTFDELLTATWGPALTGASGENINRDRAEVFADGYLTDANDWYLHYTGGVTRPFIFQQRRAMRNGILGPGSEFCINTRKIRLWADWRFRLAYMFYYRTVKTTNT